MSKRLVAGPSYSPLWFRAPSGQKIRPTDAIQVREAASQEWSVLCQEPAQAWDSTRLLPWHDAAGHRRASVDIRELGDNDTRTPSGLTFLGYLGPSSWIHLVRWSSQQGPMVSAQSVSLPGWVLTWDTNLCWWAARPAPCSGAPRPVLCINGANPNTWCSERWAETAAAQRGGYLLLGRSEGFWGDLVRPLSLQERSRIMRSSRSSRPGPSWWKTAFWDLFPDWACEAYWLLVDVQRATGIVASPAKRALQVNLPKPSGGFRPVTLLEETLKAIEGPVARRRVTARRGLSDGEVYSACNLAGEPGRVATAEVLYTDVLVCEDAVLYNRPFSRVPADYEKFFNTIQLRTVDAVDECRGIPEAARRLAFEAFSGLQIQVCTRWGPSPGFPCLRGVPQGSISGPELSKSGQEPILRVRESSPACYVTSAGRRVACAGYVDDAEHYGAGAADLLRIIQELGAGSMATGVGFAWTKFSAYASDWDEFLGEPGAATLGLSDNSILATGWDIWHGGPVSARIPRSQATTVEKLLGKSVCIADRHSNARAETLSKLTRIRVGLCSRRAAWDEITTTMQLVHRGILGYAPLVGIPLAPSLHEEEAALHRLILHALATRNTAERVGLSCGRGCGGLQVASLVEGMVGAVARDVLALLNGSSMAALLARDSLRQAMQLPPSEAESTERAVVTAMRFLAGYGVYITVSSDRLVSRILDEKHRQEGRRCQLMVGTFSPVDFSSAQRYCRVGCLANTLRLAVRNLRQRGVPITQWQHARPQWAAAIQDPELISPEECMSLCATAIAQSTSEWIVEQRLFSAQGAANPIPEDWLEIGWEQPLDPTADPRGSALWHRFAAEWSNQTDVGLFGDGGFSKTRGATFAAQPRFFGELERYWEVSQPAAQIVGGRLPNRYGH